MLRRVGSLRHFRQPELVLGILLVLISDWKHFEPEAFFDPLRATGTPALAVLLALAVFGAPLPRFRAPWVFGLPLGRSVAVAAPGASCAPGCAAGTNRSAACHMRATALARFSNFRTGRRSSNGTAPAMAFQVSTNLEMGQVATLRSDVIGKLA